jgi:hypothetical protein
MSVLVIGQQEETAIAAAIKRARANPVPWAEAQAFVADDRDNPTSTLMLDERPPGAEHVRQKYPPQGVKLGTYTAFISFEQQPAGLMRHLSVASQAQGKVPGPEVMHMTAEAFGFSAQLCEAFRTLRVAKNLALPARVWVEEFKPGHMAINVVEAEA